MILLKRRYHTVTIWNWKGEKFEKGVSTCFGHLQNVTKGEKIRESNSDLPSILRFVSQFFFYSLKTSRTCSYARYVKKNLEKYVEWNCHLLARKEKATTCEKSWNISGIRIKIQSDTLLLKKDWKNDLHQKVALTRCSNKLCHERRK